MIMAAFAQSALAQTCVDVGACNAANLNGTLFIDGVKHRSLASAVEASRKPAGS
jgi:hypothetical protein